MQSSPPPAASRSFAAFGYPAFRAQFSTFVLAMMADNIEHVISYWMVFQKFQSPALGGFAVLSHWLPFLLFSVATGALADRYDARKIMQAGMALFILVSLSWGYLFITDSLQVWHAMVLLALHGCAGVLWITPNQLLLYDIVGPQHLQSAVRLNATARYVGVLIGPGVGGAIMLWLGPSYGIFLNAAFYLPTLLWLFVAPRRQAIAGVSRVAMRGLTDIIDTAREIAKRPILISMTVLAGLAALMIGGAYHAQMPGFAHDLGHGDPGMSYSMLLAADALGALFAGVALETWSWLRPRAGVAIGLAICWAAALLGFAATGNYIAALTLLFVAGFFELSFNAMAMTLVQINAPVDMRGRVVGLFNMASLGLRAFGGVTVGLFGQAIGIHWSLGLSAAVLIGLLPLLFRLTPPAAPSERSA